MSTEAEEQEEYNPILAFGEISEDFFKLKFAHTGIRAPIVMYFLHVDVDGKYGEFGKKLKEKNLDTFLEEDFAEFKKEYPDFLSKRENDLKKLSNHKNFEEQYKDYLGYRGLARVTIQNIQTFREKTPDISGKLKDKLNIIEDEIMSYYNCAYECVYTKED